MKKKILTFAVITATLLTAQIQTSNMTPNTLTLAHEICNANIDFQAAMNLSTVESFDIAYHAYAKVAAGIHSFQPGLSHPQKRQYKSKMAVPSLMDIHYPSLNIMHPVTKSLLQDLLNKVVMMQEKAFLYRERMRERNLQREQNSSIEGVAGSVGGSE